MTAAAGFMGIAVLATVGGIGPTVVDEPLPLVTLSLSPVEGPIGTDVVASGACRPPPDGGIDFAPHTGGGQHPDGGLAPHTGGGQHPGGGLAPNGPPEVKSAQGVGTVTLYVGGTWVAEAPVQAEEYTATFTVPTNTDPGEYIVEAVCGDEVTEETFTVTLPETPTVTPTPSPTQRTVSPFPGPSPRRTSRPRLTEVPSLAGRTLEQARVLLGSELILGRVTGTGDLIERQNPAAGTSVPIGSAVNVSLSGAPPVGLVAVPDLVNRKLTEARSIVPLAGLVLAKDPGGEGTIVSQSPVPGTLVPPGSEISVVLATDPIAEPEPVLGSWITYAVGVLVLIGAGLLLVRGLARPFRRRGPTWVQEHVKIKAGTGKPAGSLTVKTIDGQAVPAIPTIAVGVAPRSQGGTCVVKEVGDD